jgi:hypothetical protein
MSLAPVAQCLLVRRFGNGRFSKCIGHAFKFVLPASDGWSDARVVKGRPLEAVGNFTHLVHNINHTGKAVDLRNA